MIIVSNLSRLLSFRTGQLSSVLHVEVTMSEDYFWDVLNKLLLIRYLRVHWMPFRTIGC